MPVDYPYNLPSPLVSQNQISPQQVVRLQQVAGGAPIAKLFSSDAWVAHNAAFSFSELEYQVFVQWYIWKALRGAKSINMKLKNSLGLTCQEVLIPSYQARQNQKRWTVTCTIIVIREEKMDECDAESLLVAHNSFEDLAYAINAINTYIPRLP